MPIFTAQQTKTVVNEVSKTLENIKYGHFWLRQLFFRIGPSGVRALPLAAGINEGGHYFAYYSSFFSFLFLPPLFKTTEGVVVGYQIFAWAPKNK
jgi:hypothetical protein